MQGKDIGNIIKDARKQKGLSQTALAELIHVDTSTISRWETGRVQLSIDNIRLICKGLDIPESDLLLQESSAEPAIQDKKRSLWRTIIIIALLMTLAILATALFPRMQYREVGEPNVIEASYGKTLVVYAKPILYYYEENAEEYSNRIAKKYEDTDGIEAIEVIIIPKDSEPNETETPLLDKTFLLNVYTMEQWEQGDN